MTTKSDSVAMQASAWTSLGDDEADDVDEPPESQYQRFQRSSIRPTNEHASLLTKAIKAQSDDESHDGGRPTVNVGDRRRSMASNISIASTADLTSDTGLTSPARTNTPSPPIPEMAVLRLNGHPSETKASAVSAVVRIQDRHSDDSKTQVAPRKRCIQFACGGRPNAQGLAPAQPPPMVKAPSAMEAPRRSCIKFAHPTRPASTQNTPPKGASNATGRSPSSTAESPSTPKKHSVLSMAVAVSTHLQGAPLSPRRLSSKHASPRPKFLRANSKDLSQDCSQFHEFASGMAREDDWIRQDSSAVMSRLTINDTLTKENQIRRLAAECEEEAALEDEDAEAVIDDDDDEELDDMEGDGDDDEEEEYGQDYEESDGYHTDEETGFADSDEDEDEEDENMILWTPSQNTMTRTAVETPLIRATLPLDQHSDSSNATNISIRRTKTQRIKPRSGTSDLPDSTDFVCGTLDEDRPLEEAYLSCRAARRNEKLRVIPQDIDPSFPASDPEDEAEEEIYNPVHHDSDENEWLPGEMEDLHHEQDRSRRRKKGDRASPRKYHSPPPKRHHSPPPKIRGRSPNALFDRNSPRRIKSPAPKAITTPIGSLRYGCPERFNLAGRAGMTQTKSLPRPAALFRIKRGRSTKHTRDDDIHVRGAIDIVKGLEEKRLRRKEKFHQKYCNRARRGQIPERKPQPGRGAERMRELGLLMAGKKDQGNYVLSI